MQMAAQFAQPSRPAMPDEKPAAPSAAERTRAYRARLREAGATRADRPKCLLCPNPILLAQIDPVSPRGKSRTGRVLCAACWRKSDEGKAAERERYRARRKATATTEEASQ